ncbi:MAG: hypothetical protein ACRDD8_15730 [Bacteroidales bacterium]
MRKKIVALLSAFDKLTAEEQQVFTKIVANHGKRHRKSASKEGRSNTKEGHGPIYDLLMAQCFIRIDRKINVYDMDRMLLISYSGNLKDVRLQIEKQDLESHFFFHKTIIINLNIFPPLAQITNQNIEDYFLSWNIRISEKIVSELRNKLYIFELLKKNSELI